VIDLIVDGNSLFARSWYAVMRPDCTGQLINSTDEAIRAGLVSLISILNIHNDKIGEKVDRALFCWDGETRKNDKDRKPKPPEYRATRSEFKQLLSHHFGGAHVTAEEHEADDAIATAVYQNKTASRIYVVSGDKDLQQLQGINNTCYYCLNEKCLLTRTLICHKWHVKKPSQIAIALAIKGDQADNIPGIYRWGDAKVKKVFEAVTEEMDFEEAFNVVDRQIPADKKDEFYTSLDLTLLHTDVPNVPDPAPLKLQPLEEIERLGFRDLVPFYRQLYHQYTGMSTARSIDEDDADPEY
jgi:5'-3' exonuclease